MAQKNRAKYGYLSYSDMLTRISEGKLDAYDICYTTDTKESYVITPDLLPFPIKSRVYVFDNIVEAEEVLNQNTDTYIGQLVSILVGETYRGYIVNRVDEKFTLTPLSESSEPIDYNTLGNKPIVNLIGTLEEPIIISELDNGIYSIKGQHKLSVSDITTYINPNPSLFIVEKSNETDILCKKISSNEIVDYVISNDTVQKTNKIITEEYLQEKSYATTTYVDEKIATLELLNKEEIETYITSIIEEQLDDILDEKIEEVIDKKIQSASDEQITSLFTN